MGDQIVDQVELQQRGFIVIQREQLRELIDQQVNRALYKRSVAGKLGIKKLILALVYWLSASLFLAILFVLDSFSECSSYKNSNNEDVKVGCGITANDSYRWKVTSFGITICGLLATFFIKTVNFTINHYRFYNRPGISYPII